MSTGFARSRLKGQTKPCLESTVLICSMVTEVLLPAEATHLLAPIPVQILRSKLSGDEADKGNRERGKHRASLHCTVEHNTALGWQCWEAGLPCPHMLGSAKNI